MASSGVRENVYLNTKLDDLAKACGTYKIFVLFDENTDLKSNKIDNIYEINACKY